MLFVNHDFELDTSDTNLFLEQRLGIAHQRSEKTNKLVETEPDDFIIEIDIVFG